MRSTITPLVRAGALAACLATGARAAGEPAMPEDPVIAAVRDDALMAAHGRGDMGTYRAGLSATRARRMP